MRRFLAGLCALLFLVVPVGAFSQSLGPEKIPASANLLSPRDLGARGDCTTSDSSIWAITAVAALAQNKVMWVGDACYALDATFVPPAGLVLRSDFSDAHRVKWIGAATTDVVEVTGAFDVDGLVIDGNRPGGAVRASSAASKLQNIFGVHGPMTTGSPSYLTGVKIGRLRVFNTQARTAILFVNVSGLKADRLEVKNSWGAAVMFAGLKDSVINTIDTVDIGAFQAEGSRWGQVVSNFPETDPQKKPANWYLVNDVNNAPANILPTTMVNIGSIRSVANTDTLAYSHDFQGLAGIGVSDVHFGSIYGEYCGKDAFKARSYTVRISVDSITAKNCGNRFVVIEHGSVDTRVGWINGVNSGYDVVGWMTGTPAVFTGGANNGLGQTLTTSPGGVYIGDSAVGATIGGGMISGVKLSPVDGSQGHGLYIQDASKIDVKLSMDTIDANGIRISHADRFKVEATIRDAARATYALTSGTQYFGLVNNDGGGVSTNGALKLRFAETSGSAKSPQAFRLNDADDNIDIDIEANPADFTLANWGVVSKIDATATNIRHKPIAYVRKNSATPSPQATTDANGQFSLPHGLYTAPVAELRSPSFPAARLAVVAVDATKVTGRFIAPAADATNYWPATTGVVAGTPGTIPTDWGLGSGITLVSVATGTETNPYIDLALSGTGDGSAKFITLGPITSAIRAIAATRGDTFTFTGGVRLTAGSFTGIPTATFRLVEYDQAGTSALTSSTLDLVAAPTSTSTRTLARTLNNSATARLQPDIRFVPDNGAAWAFTIRIGGAGGAPNLARSWIVNGITPVVDLYAEVRNANGY